MSTSLLDHAQAPLAVGSPRIGWSIAAAVEQNAEAPMTFYEAALQILQREGRPLHAREIAEIAVRENLLSHVGKQPEITMASRLAAMARRSQDRRLVAVEPDTFALAEWNVPGSPDALAQSGLPVVYDESEPPLRGRERHPRIDKENVRVAGRSDRRRKHEEAERRRKKKKRLSQLGELVFEILDRAGRSLPAFDIAAAIREHDLYPEELGRDALEKALAAENERREAEGRSPVFVLEEGRVGLVDRVEPEEEVDLAALAREVAARIAEERKPAEVAVPEAPGGLEQLVEAERARAVGLLRQRLLELETSALEAVVQRMLEVLGYRDVRVAKRHRDGSLFTTRRRTGLTEMRYAVRVLRGGREVRREDVAELRRDLQSHSAHIGVIVSPADATREARSEVAQPGAGLVALLCAEAFAEQLAARGLGVRSRTVTVMEFDPASFRDLAGAEAEVETEAEGEAEARQETAAERRERRERERRERRERRQREREERRLARAAAEAESEEGEAEEAEEAVAAGEEVEALPEAEPIAAAPEEEAAAEEAEPAAPEEAEPAQAAEEGVAAPAERRRRRRRRGRGAAAAPMAVEAAEAAEGEAAVASGALGAEAVPPGAGPEPLPEGEASPAAGEVAGALEAGPAPAPEPVVEPEVGGGLRERVAGEAAVHVEPIGTVEEGAEAAAAEAPPAERAAELAAEPGAPVATPSEPAPTPVAPPSAAVGEPEEAAAPAEPPVAPLAGPAGSDGIRAEPAGSPEAAIAAAPAHAPAAAVLEAPGAVPTKPLASPLPGREGPAAGAEAVAAAPAPPSALGGEEPATSAGATVSAAAGSLERGTAPEGEDEERQD